MSTAAGCAWSKAGDHVARIARAVMIFRAVQGRHQPNEAEYSPKEQCAAGGRVLLQAVLDYGHRLAERCGK